MDAEATPPFSIRLAKGRERSVERRHPWIFSGALIVPGEAPPDGSRVDILTHDCQKLGTGHWSHGSIAVRLFHFGPDPVPENIWELKLRSALELRLQLGLAGNPETTMYRLVHGEGDGLPGLIVDWYGGCAVMQFHSAGMQAEEQALVNALRAVMGDRLKAVYRKGLDASGGWVVGEVECPSQQKENGLSFLVDWREGQKTGFFIDQRENRLLLEKFSRDRHVLNAFSYTGAFSMYALRGGARSVVSVDSSEPALALAEKQAALNGFSGDRHRTVKADVMEFLKHPGTGYDLIVLDPPAFAKHLKARHNAVVAYKRINLQAFRNLSPGGLLFTFSCSQAVDFPLFRNTVMAAAYESGKDVSLLHQLHQPADHPVSLGHPEGDYLKGLVLQLR